MKSSIVFAATVAAMPAIPGFQQLTLSPTNLIDQVVGLLPFQKESSKTPAADHAAHTSGMPSKEDAARVARTLIHRESLTTLVTVNKDDVPEGYMEYYADCGDDGNPVMLNVHIGTGFRNIAAGSAATLSVRVGDHPVTENTNPWYPGGIVKSAAGSPRVSLRGKFKDLEKDEIEAVEKCFLQRHPDAKWWLPGNKVHSTSWVKFEVDSLHMVGGFGDRAYIGEISGEVYRNAKILNAGELKSGRKMSTNQLLKTHAGLSKDADAFMKAHSGEEYEAAVKSGKHHQVSEGHGKNHAKDKLLEVHAAHSDNSEAFIKAHSGEEYEAAVKAGKHHKMGAHHGKKQMMKEELLKIHAKLSGKAEEFMKVHSGEHSGEHEHGEGHHHSEGHHHGEGHNHGEEWIKIHKDLL